MVFRVGRYKFVADLLKERFAGIYRKDPLAYHKARKGVALLPEMMIGFLKAGKYVYVGEEGFTTALEICVLANQRSVGEELLALMRSSQKMLTIRQVEAALAFNARDGRISRCKELFVIMKRHKLTPTRRAYTQMLRCIALAQESAFDPTPTRDKTLRWNAAVKVFLEATKAGFNSLTIHHSLLYVAQSWSHCTFVLRRMRTARLSPDVLTYNLMLRVGARNAGGPLALAEADALMKRMRQRGLRPNCSTYTTYLTLCQHADDAVGRAVGVLRDMARNGVQPNRVTAAAFVALLSRNHTHPLAVPYAEQSMHNSLLKSVHSTELFRGVMALYAKRGDAHKALALVHLMWENSCVLTAAIREHFDTAVKGTDVRFPGTTLQARSTTQIALEVK
eukprot:TRINITY_DN39315_c0_g1_i1.p1 TRINITY_DN39315_c0_g1~~TRINITY_DN39315_c0_g1_i1.p1  ORF type:complete len:392 (+),score=95.44 TRINITY_DN39315_c0_g1_i1:117-1292(+)